ncbi:hypothetical protein VTI74DRAFT_6445 [Chaetomium olivicolor]
MALRGGPRLQVGSASWIAEERDSALSIAQSEIDEFSFAARNEIDWLNEHMAEIFSENQVNVAELFKTPGKLRGKTPRTARKAQNSPFRVPLSDVFSAAQEGAPNPSAISNLPQPQSPKIHVAEDKAELPASRPESPAKPAVVHPPHRVESRPPISLADSGYHGSQSQDTMPSDDFDKDIEMSDSPQRDLRSPDPVLPRPTVPAEQRSLSMAPVEEAFQQASESPARPAAAQVTASVAPTPTSAVFQGSSPFASRTRLPIMSPRSPSPKNTPSPIRHATQKLSSSPQKPAAASPQKGFPKPTEDLMETVEQVTDGTNDADEVDGARSPSEASSPIRPIGRKSSLNFPSLPAREPLAFKKSLGGARVSRTSHLDFNRQSHYNRHTGGKSLGNMNRPEFSDDDHDDMDIDEDATVEKDDSDSKVAAHSKTYTQRLQDQISMLGKAQSTGSRPSKSLANFLPSQQGSSGAQSQPQAESAVEARKLSSPRLKHSVPAPGAYPEDDEDDWIAPPNKTSIASPKSTPPISSRSDAIEELTAQATSGGMQSPLPQSRPASPGKASFTPQWTPKHGKSASVPVLPTLDQIQAEEVALKKTISVSNPTLTAVAENDLSFSPPKSPTRSFRDSPLKQVKNKLSSLLKSSKGLIASSAAISAEGKSSLLQSPSTARLGYHAEPSVESFKTADMVVYPDLSQKLPAASPPPSPVRTNSAGRTRVSTERERVEAKEREKEEKQREREKEKEIKEAKLLAEQMEKLDKVREKEREKARVFSKEQEKITAMEKEVIAQREQQKASQAQPSAQDFRTPGPSRPRSPVKPTRTTPRKAKGQLELNGKSSAPASDEADLEMTDVTTTVPPPSIPRPTTASSMRAQGTKRPLKPTKETLTKSKQAPTLIRVNTTSSQQTQFHPSNSVLAATLQETLAQPTPSARSINGKASQASLHGKQPLKSLASSVSSTGRPKALEFAAKRDAKLEMERKRAAQEEERRQEQRRLEAERQKEEERKAAQAKKATIERAKLTKAPPPAARSQPNGPPEYSMADRAPARPPSRLGSAMHQESRLVNTALTSNAKGPSKRPLQQDAGEESSRTQQQRALPSFPAKEGKRMRMSEEFDEDIDMMESHNAPIIKGPPVRPSGGFKKDLPPKSMFSSGYSNPPPSASRDLYKATVTAQHNSHIKAGHPLDMAKISKGTIPFAPNPNHQAGGSSHRTPARPVGGAMPKSAKSAARSSPRVQNGELIELPDIQTDDDSDEDDGHVAGGGVAPAWTNSPALRDGIIRQEQIDPMQVFGPPAPFNMEEVFNKTKERWGKFRARTSSANWSGTDRLTEEDIRKDLAARDKMRREGGWSYELSREMS